MKRNPVPPPEPDKVVFQSRRRQLADMPAAEAVGERSPAPSDDVKDTKIKAVPVTDIDRAHAAMTDGGEAELFDFYKTLAEADLFVLLDEPTEPRIFPIEDAEYVLVFDLMERLSGFAGENAPTTHQTGLSLFNRLRGRSIGMVVNMGDGATPILISSDAVDWVCETLNEDKEPVPAATATPTPTVRGGKFKALLAPRNFPDTLFLMLNEKLRRVETLVDKALLLWAEYLDGKAGFVVAFSGVEARHRSDVADAVSEALDAAQRNDFVIDIAFLPDDEPSLDRISRLATHLILSSAKRKKVDRAEKPLILRKRVD